MAYLFYILASCLVARIVWIEEHALNYRPLPKLYLISVFLGMGLGLETRTHLGSVVDTQLVLWISIGWYTWAAVSLVMAVRTAYQLYWLDVRVGRDR